MHFEWDEQKNALNLKRHKIRFETAALVFEDPHAITLHDVAHEDEEERFITLGWIGSGVIAFVVHTCFEMDAEEVIRIISARKSTSQEKKIYETANKTTAPRHRRSRRDERRRR